MTKTQYVAALRDLADFVEKQEFPESWKGWWNEAETFATPKLEFNVHSKSDFGKICAAMGSFEKERTSYSTGAKKTLPGGAIVSVSANRDVVCKRVVVGTKTVPAEPERIIEARPERTEEIVEWECPESFVALKSEEEEANVNA